VEAYTLPELLALADDDARRRWEHLSLAYTEASGLPALRQEIALMYERVDASGVFLVAGAQEGIFLLANSLLSAGDEAVVVTPSYQSLHEVPRSLGAVVRPVLLRFDQGWQLDPDDVARAVTPRTRLIAINFPHNPTGAHISANVQRRLVEIAERAGAVLLSDEVYRGLEADPLGRLPLAADLSESAVSLGVMSKAFALPGLRIGWLATRNATVLARVARLKDYTTICNSAPSEVLALIALRARERVLERSRAIVSANRRAATQFFSEHAAAVSWVAPVAGSVAFPRFVSRNADDVAAQLVEQESTLLVPGKVFGGDAAHFRIGLGRRDLPEALQCLGRVL
jgi:aspartate/methionine/tyrosine aminotransferase